MWKKTISIITFVLSLGVVFGLLISCAFAGQGSNSTCKKKCDSLREIKPAMQQTEKLKEWENLDYGMFICFGMSTFTDGYDTGDSPPTVYAPTDLDVKQWIRVAKQAGMKYAVLTVKHVAGFCLWDSEGYEHDIGSSGNKIDIVAEYMAACKAEGIKPGIYYCVMDGKNEEVKYGQPGALGVPVTEEYFELIKHHLTELHTRYRGIYEQWIDIPQKLTSEQKWQLYRHIKKLIPDCIVLMNQGFQNAIEVNVKKSWPTDLLNCERNMPPASGHNPVKDVNGSTYYIPVEVCDIAGKEWYWRLNDPPKPAKLLYQYYLACKQRNANLLLSVPVDRTGQIPQEYVTRLKEVKRAIDKPELMTDVEVPVSFKCKPAASNMKENNFGKYSAFWAFDGDLNTRWATDDNLEKYWLIINLGSPATFNRIKINEHGNSIRKFQLLYKKGDKWETFIEGSEIGKEWTKSFEPITAQEVRMNILETDKGPSIREFQIFAPRTMVKIPEVCEHQSVVQANMIAELTFVSTKEYDDPFNEVVLDVIFTDPDGVHLTVPAFWAGGNIWKARYSSSNTGMHNFVTNCSDTKNKSLNNVTGSVNVLPYEGANKLYKHGPIKISANGRYFEQADGTPFLWLGDTSLMGFTDRLNCDDFKKVLSDRQQKGFSVMQVIGGLYPDMAPFDERSKNQAGFSWQRDYSRINPGYFDFADKKVELLVEREFVPCIVGSWGFYLPMTGVEKMKKHWRHLVGRYAAFPVVWVVAGETDMGYYTLENREKFKDFQKKGWTEIAHYLHEIDPYKRPVTTHPRAPFGARDMVLDVNVLDFDMLQIGHVGPGSIVNTIELVNKSFRSSPTMPTVVGENSFEELMASALGDVQRFIIWTAFLSGAAGHTYGGNGLWQMNKLNEPFGPTPHGVDWAGNTPWFVAMNFKGSYQCGLAKKFLEQYPWYKFEFHTDWCTYKQKSQPVFSMGEQIQCPGEESEKVSSQKRWYRRTFDLPKDVLIQRAPIAVWSSGQLSIYLNGKLLGKLDGEKEYPIKRIDGAEDALKPGKNVVTVSTETPEAFMINFYVVLESEQAVKLYSDFNWSCSKQYFEEWMNTDFDDTNWKKVKYKDTTFEQYNQTYAGGIPGKIRVIYLPHSAPATVQKLEPDSEYKASYFDPVTGQSGDLGIIKSDENGCWGVKQPKSLECDWVLILEKHQ